MYLCAGSEHGARILSHTLYLRFLRDLKVLICYETNGAEKFKDVVKNALYVEDYLLERAKNDNTDPETGVLDRGRYQKDICTYGSWMNDEIKMSRMAGVAAPLLGASAQAVMNQMIKFQQAEDKKQEVVNARALVRSRTVMTS